MVLLRNLVWMSSACSFHGGKVAAENGLELLDITRYNN